MTKLENFIKDTEMKKQELNDNNEWIRFIRSLLY